MPAALLEAADLNPVRMQVREPYLAYRGRIEDLPRCLEAEGVVLHSRRNLIKAVSLAGPEEEPIEVAVKAFRVPARPQGFIYARLRPSKAQRSMANAEKLLELGISTPEPVACLEYEDAGLLRESYYFSRYWPHNFNLTTFLSGRGPSNGRMDKLLEQLARFTLLQHDRGVLHLDYNSGNILTRSRKESFEFALVDLNRLRFGSLDLDDRVSGLVRLTGSAEHLRSFGRRYADLHGVDPVRFCRRLERAQRRFIARNRTTKRIKSLVRYGIR